MTFALGGLCVVFLVFSVTVVVAVAGTAAAATLELWVPSYSGFTFRRSPGGPPRSIAFAVPIWAATELDALQALMALRANLDWLAGLVAFARLVVLDCNSPGRTQEGRSVSEDCTHSGSSCSSGSSSRSSSSNSNGDSSSSSSSSRSC